MAPTYSGSDYLQTPADSYASTSGYDAELGTETPDTIAKTRTTCLLSQDGIPCKRCFFKMPTIDAPCEPQLQVLRRPGPAPTACKNCRRKHKKCVNFSWAFEIDIHPPFWQLNFAYFPKAHHVDVHRILSYVPMETGEFRRNQSKIELPDQNEMIEPGAQDGEIHEQQRHEQQHHEQQHHEQQHHEQQHHEQQHHEQQAEQRLDQEVTPNGGPRNSWFCKCPFGFSSN
ncbi:hypothetical protein N7509_002834 [Penicillium cosmopolitanum]|uniref:Uncharacterized protein n=1 Tax=Penicillium cosmopolitanum TaxID=1131564 RepID=A0A9W9W9J7_9EURO|nr:uncharacterized protein N7509_002834 [Penicillium cosmopolitanum]KAJ5408951.1 hypothetical protein N7509_002834 [Penicillium cosmopolitanum]